MAQLDNNNRAATFRTKLIADTQRWLGARLPASDHSAVVGDGPRLRVGSRVVAFSDERGHLDNERLSDLIDRLYPLAEDRSRGDIIVDLSDVSSATRTLVSVLNALLRYLAPGGRRVVVCEATNVLINGLRLADFTPLPDLGGTVTQHHRLEK